MKILLAGSDNEWRGFLAQSLADQDHKVLEAATGESAWMTFRIQTPRVVITERALGESDGLELCRRIRGQKDTKYTYIIILTSEDGKVKYLDAMNAGADDVLAKPCEVMDIVLRLRVAERLLHLKTKVNQLEGLLPICSYCKRIRDDHEEWQPVDRFVKYRSDASFSHGVCPDCYHEHIVPQLQLLAREKSTPER
ncbi:MAG: response regulator [Ignavibacteriales bacterium]|nr:response regulator [Ignavibacteriales bacterium]